jgi:hypothetical protein
MEIAEFTFMERNFKKSFRILPRRKKLIKENYI